MLKAIREEFRISLDRTHWMDEKSRKAGQEKLDKMFFEVAYPDVWPESAMRNDGKVLEDLSFADNVNVIGSSAIERARVRILVRCSVPVTPSPPLMPCFQEAFHVFKAFRVRHVGCNTEHLLLSSTSGDALEKQVGRVVSDCGECLLQPVC